MNENPIKKHLNKLNQILFITAQHRCKECGADTRQGAYDKLGFNRNLGAYVNRVPAYLEHDFECYICGMCSETFEECLDDDETSTYYYKFLEERIKEVDHQDPIAKLFREFIEELE